jgi:osmoprotectant transport system permease protein
MVMFGVVSAAVLAIALDLLIGGLQKASQRTGSSRPGTSPRVYAMLGLLLAVIVGGILSPTIVRTLRSPDALRMAADDPAAVEAAERPVIRIGAKTFTEQYILAALIDQTLSEAGFRTTRTESLGSIVIFDALASGELDVYVDYSGTIWANNMNRDDAPPPWRVLAEMNGWLAQVHNIRSLGTLGFENAYALVMRRDHADELNITTIDDLAEHTPGMEIGGDYEFFGRPEWRQIRDSYGLNFRDHISYDSSIMYEAVALGQVDVISAFSSDGRIAAFDLVTLEDTRQVIPPYDAVLMLGPAVSARQDVAEALLPLINAIDVELMREANHMVDRDEDRRTIEQAARWLREQIAP